MRISHNDSMERRRGLWRAGFDGDGELYCDQRYGDWPLAVDAPPFAKPDWMLLSYEKPVSVSSGIGAERITDENVRTWWNAASAASGEWAEVDLQKTYDVRAIQINFADDGIKAAMPEASVMAGYDRRYIERNPGPTQWLLEGSTDGEEYFTVCDKSGAVTDLPHDFIMPENGIQTRYLRLTIKQLPYNQTPRISGIRVFGNGGDTAPEKAADVSIKRTSDLDMEVSWKKSNATGYNILWGYAPDKLYHSYMVFGKNAQRIGALIKGEPVYVRVDAFNENGITEGDVREMTK
jgi:hypothetical protein